MSCQHQFYESRTPHYDMCRLCGTYRSRNFADPEKFYAGKFWGEGHSTPYEQCWNVDMHTEGGFSKNRFVLDRIEVKRDSALDIGCSPGRLLFWLTYAARFKRVVGVEPGDHAVVRKLGVFDGALLGGLFPDATSLLPRSSFDYISALDVLEHSPSPILFIAECSRLLNPCGQLFMMLPLADCLPPDSKMFSPAEHVYLHSMAHLRALLEGGGFGSIKFARWATGHDTVSARKLA